MDEVENPSLPAAGESSPTLGPMDEDEDSGVDLGSPAGSPTKPGMDTVEAEAILEGGDATSPQGQTRFQLPQRPALKRESSGPPPHQAPPPPPDLNDVLQEPPDSLTLADLKRIRSSFPNAQPAQKQQLQDYRSVYDFEYQDAQSLPAELEEWFSYSEEEQWKIDTCRARFQDKWKRSEHGKTDWTEAPSAIRKEFIKKNVEHLAKHYENNSSGAVDSLFVLTYISLGAWEETAGRKIPIPLIYLFPSDKGGGSRLEEYTSSGMQLRWILQSIETLYSCGGLKVIYGALQKLCQEQFDFSPPDQLLRNEPQPRRPDECVELWCCLTLMYLFIEVARTTASNVSGPLKKDIIALEPSLLTFFTQAVAKLRWDEYAPIPLTKMLLLCWKTILVVIGGIKDVQDVKASLGQEEEEIDTRGQPVITASPLDYHLFRQEISSKYPAYQPPPPLFPLEPENNSILPPLKHRRPYYEAMDSSYAGAPTVGTGSIMHQPVHIATPAPSPPPSPAGPGKAGKKQNYQTNQMFPFLYPPLDATSNELGGRGSTELQDALVGRKWEGADVPTSILEAAELFSKRMRATRAMKQLWEARVDFMKYERGWKASNQNFDEEGEFELVEKLSPEETAEQGKPIVQTDEQRRLAAVNRYYQESLPHMQSVVIVLLKAVLQNVTDMVTKAGQNGLQAGFQFNDVNGINGAAKPAENGTSHNGEGAESSIEELDKLRSQEIAGKALSGILLLLLKWFKVSHILQYEYLTQLLVDSNYVPLILKLWQTQEIGRACHYKVEKPELNFFHQCQENSRQGAPESPEEDKPEESEDEALPPPIKLKREEPPEASLHHPLSPTALPSEFSHPPEIDELGYPQTPLPSTPITSYSWRNAFTAINYLRILQKVTRRKTHRALLLVSYKSSNHLKKTLKIPIYLLRYYTLKLFKSQVPFCGRKWRQGNMKIITAVWLSVPAELRDDWLSGGGGGMGGACVGDVDGTVEDAVPLEQSLRALTHWWNVRNYPEVMGWEKGMEDEEMDYFTRELEKMEVVRDAAEEALEAEAMVDDGVPWQGPIEGY